MNLNPFWIAGVMVAGFALIGYLVSRLLKRNDVGDGFWGWGFVAMAFAEIESFATLSFRGRLVLAFVILWGGRLSIHLWTRLWGKEEDRRYANWRREWGSSEPIRSFFQVFLLQGVILGFVSLPLIASVRAPVIALNAWNFAGAGLFLVGFLFEAVSDAELRAFKRVRKSGLLTTGLWAWSRHPNYFGEILIWWGFFLLSVGTPLGWISLLSPLLITFLLLKVSGVPMLEAAMSGHVKELHGTREGIPAVFPFRGRDLRIFGAIFLALVVLDFIWLGILMGKFYFEQSRPIARTLVGRQGETWDVLLWAAILVYVFLALGVQFFAVRGSKGPGEAIFRGSFFGLVAYAVYEFTNLSLVRNWPFEMAMLDLSWGVVICGVASWLGHRVAEANATLKS